MLPLAIEYSNFWVVQGGSKPQNMNYLILKIKLYAQEELISIVEKIKHLIERNFEI